MTTLTVAAVLALASSCQSVVAPELIVKVATQESNLDPAIVHHNKNGSLDVGLMQINDRNWPWLNRAIPGLNLNMQSALDPCKSIAAGAAILSSLSAYNTGSPTKGIHYATAVLNVQSPTTAPDAPPPSPPCPATTDDGWHTIARPPGCPDPTD